MVRDLLLKNVLGRLIVLACSILAVCLVATQPAGAQTAAYQLAFTTTPPLPTNLAPKAQLSGAQITIEDSNGNTVSSSDQIKIKITGPGGYVAGPFKASATSGVANISFQSSVEFDNDGLYTLTATDIDNSQVLPANQVAGVDQALLPQHQLTSQSSNANPSANAIYSGVFYNPDGQNPGTHQKDDPVALETDVNRNTRAFATDMHYVGWTLMEDGQGNPNYDTFLNKYIGFPNQNNKPDSDLLNSRIPIISWGCDKLGDFGDRSTDLSISLGKEDSSVIDPTAAALKLYGAPVFIRWFWEMNWGDSNCLGPAATKDADFIAAWKYIVDRFAYDKVTNVIWLWNPLGDAEEYYPTDPYVDWVGSDIYADANTSSQQWEEGNFYNTYNSLLEHGKPMLLGETGAHDGNGCTQDQHGTDADDQGAFFVDGVQSLSQGFVLSNNPTGYPDFLGVSYFDSPNGEDTCDWEILEGQTPPTDLDAFETFYQAPYMLATNVPKTSYPYYATNGHPGVAYDKYIHFVVNPVQISSGTPVPLWVTVNSLDGLTAPQAGVTVYMGASYVAHLTRVSCNAGISCKYTGVMSNVTAGQHSLIAEYLGDSENPEGQSGPINITVQ